jgi:epoxyqueuosine reductase
MSTLEDEIRAQGHALGFHRVGIAPAEELEPEHARYRDFLDAGMQGEMEYLARNVEVRRRLDSEFILPGTRSVVVCALAYRRAPDEPRGPAGGTIARYARGADYHNFMRKRLRRFATWLRERVPGSESRAMVDTAPVLERAWAQRAGVGFVGKNGCIIAPGLGSFVLLGEVATTVDLTPDAPLESRCGSCTLCLDACPTDAFPRPFVLDARRCVSYLTIELRGPIPVALREGVGDRLFGCDECQDVCPYNRTALPSAESTAPFAPGERWTTRTLEELIQLDETTFRRVTEGSPLGRPGRAGLARNAAVVMGNAGERRYLPILHSVALQDADAMVRETARWAIETIERKGR